MSPAEKDLQTISAVEKALQAVTVALLSVCCFFLVDLYGRFQSLERQVHLHEIEAASRFASLEAHE